ncbi:N-acetylglucosamine-6-phosphate deacetylase [Catenovulum agarivorans DS-2]|uniref:N-acetylgalactosamine-6-phosphate deacetylase n=1 Tax=Catenovulum agarivorans DS-2 TaxID=1328313 RepID=W7QJL0_9ALTE|nr:N-acetylglucosamine-6-phosphate deacetylase [Catenovulum agarivorans]EWH09147.1 N-acetylglucosamine-6-phosphate deacetylase [Catenovulum agarivorans DS-2]
MKQHYRPDRLFDGKKFIEQPIVTVENGLIAKISFDQPEAEIVELAGLLAPGYIDVQVNGGGGVLFNNAPTLATLKTMVAAHAKFGTTAMLPTLITDDIKVMQQGADAIATAISQQMPGILGVHFEGPHLSVAKRGVHPKDQVRGISQAEWAVFARQDLGIKKVTIAPETVSPDEISRLTELGCIVSIGHSNGSYQQAIDAISAGVSGFTHLYNAMSPLSSREPGIVGAALTAQQSYCGIIVDLHHVHPEVARLAFKCKGVDKLALVTDAMALIGSEKTKFELFGEEIELKGDKLQIATGQLAGSHLSMQQAVQNCVNHLDLLLADSLNMASLTPANWLGIAENYGSLTVGKRADWVVLDKHLNVMQSCIAGHLHG